MMQAHALEAKPEQHKDILGKPRLGDLSDMKVS